MSETPPKNSTTVTQHYDPEMVENAAKINYQYGGMAARNAFERQQVLYNRTYQDQSYANKVAQMDAAGLSPGLMYGGGGASGGGAGSTTGAPMGATGDRKSTRLNSSHSAKSRMPSSA